MKTFLEVLDRSISISQLDSDVSVVDTGTQADETSLLVVTAIEFVWSRALDGMVQGLSRPYGVPA